MRRYLAVGLFLVTFSHATLGYAEDMDWQNDAEATMYPQSISPLQAAINADRALLEQRRRELADDKLHHADKIKIQADETAIKANEQKLKADQQACLEDAEDATLPSNSSPNPEACQY